MKQPELGKKISEIRKQKGLTQEDLVAKCNIYVRTIQRIETGEVTPRSYTLKIILDALDYDLQKINEEFNSDEKNATRIPKHFSLTLKLAFWFGIVLIITSSFSIFLATVKGLEPKYSYLVGFKVSKTLNTILELICLISSFGFYFGFFKAGEMLNNSLLKVTSLLFMVVGIISFSTTIFMDDAEKFTTLYYVISSMIFHGCVGIPFGIGILKLNNHFGKYATITGIFTIILFSSLLTVILFFVSIFLALPVMILQLILLYKIKEHYDLAKNIPL